MATCANCGCPLGNSSSVSCKDVFIAKKVVVGKSHNILKQLMGGIVQMVVTKEVTKNADGIIDIGKNLFSKIVKSTN